MAELEAGVLDHPVHHEKNSKSQSVSKKQVTEKKADGYDGEDQNRDDTAGPCQDIHQQEISQKVVMDIRPDGKSDEVACESDANAVNDIHS